MKRNKFNLGYYHLLTCDMGQLIPAGLTEVMPGDSFQHSMSMLIRLSPLAAPVMHPVTARVHHFFVPHRLIWEKAGGTGTFEDYITSGRDGTDTQLVPTMPLSGTKKGLLDYYGLPTHADAVGTNVSTLPLVGFNEIFNEYYADQDLVTLRVPLDETVPRVAWEKDYLTAARPAPQKGPDITLPIAGQAPIVGLGKTNQTYGSTNTTVYESGGSGTTTYASSSNPSAETWHFEQDPNNPGFPGVFADLTQAEAVKVNEFRKAFALQRYAEARSRYGSRYTEYLRYLGINPSDARLDRPEYLGGGKVRVSISEVLQTGPEGSTPVRDYGVGDMYGHGVAALRSNRYRRFFEEHGYVHTLISIRPKAMYQNAIERHWLRTDRESQWQRELQHIGQQEVYVSEVYGSGTTGKNTFGWQDRYSELRGSRSRASAEFRDVLNYWHLARDFATEPALNETFVQCEPSKRIFNEQTQNSLWVMVQHRLAARRLLARNAANRIL